jgi:hemolysin D
MTDEAPSGPPRRGDLVPARLERRALDRRGIDGRDVGRRDLERRDNTRLDRRARHQPQAKGRLLGRDDGEFHPAALRLIETPGSPINRPVALAIFALFAVALAWAYFGRLDSNTEGEGRIQTSGRSRVLESISAGRVLKIAVHNGDSVKAGQVLVELDPTDALAARTITAQKLADARAEGLRRRVEIAAARKEQIDPRTPIVWPDDMPPEPRRRQEAVAFAELTNLATEIAALTAQMHAKEAERDKFILSIDAQKALVSVTKENITMIETLLKGGFNSQAQYLDMKSKLDGQQVTLNSFEGALESAKQAIQTIASQIAKLRETFITANIEAAAVDDQTILNLTQDLVEKDRTLATMSLKSPVDGIVHASAVTTIGQVIRPSQQLMQIVPRNTTLEIVAFISNQDIGFIHKGDPATIKVNAFTYGTYGSIDGIVTDLATDVIASQGKPTVQDASLDEEAKATSAAQKTGNLQYPVTIRALRNYMRVEGRNIPLVPGMTVNVEIFTEARSPLDYIVSPLIELISTAGHEK